MPKKISRARAKAESSAHTQTRPAISVAISIFLIAIVWTVFGQTLQARFLNYDDDLYVFANPKIVHGLTLHGIRWAFAHVHADNWHPLTTLSHMLDCQLYGLQPWGHHLTNVLLHATAAILLFLALRKLTGALWRSALVATLFAIHPLRTESVAWISERKDVLSGVFFMLTLWFYGRYARSARRSLGRYATVLVFFALGLMCKPTLVTLPFVLLLMDYWPLRRAVPNGSNRNFLLGWKQLIAEKIPFFVLSAVSSIVTIYAQQGALERSLKQGLAARISNAVESYVSYLGQTIYPMRLAVLYPFGQNQFQISGIVIALLLLVGISAVFFLRRDRFPFLLTGWLWFLGMMVPMVGLVQVGLQSRADRYTYLPQIGLCLLATWGVAELSTKWRHGREISVAVALLIITTLVIRSRDEASYWRNSETLWQHAINNTSENSIAHNSLGNALLEKGQSAAAIAQYRRALEIKPGVAEVHRNLGNALLRERQVDEAVTHFQRALELTPDYAEAYDDMGNASMDQGLIDQAIGYYQRAVQINPTFAGAYNNLAIAHLQSGQLDEAISNYRKAVAIEPDSVEMQYNLGNALASKGLLAEAATCYQAALRIRPDYAEARQQLRQLDVKK